ncbi:MAG: S41 family peptidase [Acidobacteriota bacterium]
MSKRLFLTGLFCILVSTGGAFGQAAKPNPQVASRIVAVDPFKIESGSLFSASSSQPTKVARPNAAESERTRVISDFEEALQIVKDRYAGGAPDDTSELTKSAISGMLRTLDPHSSFFDAAEYRDMLDEQQSEYSGIGSTIVNYNRDGENATYVIANAADGPAARAGLAFGDRIVAVNGELMVGKTSDVVRDKVRGPGGTTVKLTIEHAATGKTDIIELRRGRLYQPSLPDAYILGQGVGYIDLTTGFNFTTAAELETAVKRLKREGMESLILDLRGNPGGILDQAIKVAEKFLPAGSVVVSQRGRYHMDSRVWRSANRAPETMPLVLLVDENSASASEVVAGALQDHDRALIIGEKTFGKGLVQNVVDLPFGAGLTITTARYLTPSGRSIQRDYSNGSIYDYYNHKGGPAASELERYRATTDAKREVFGGDGITPDELIPAERFSGIQESLIDPLFYFSVAAATGQVPGLERLAVKQSAVGPADFRSLPDTDVMKRFVAFSQQSGVFDADHKLSDAEERFIAVRLQYNLVMSRQGAAAAARVLIANDPQVTAAVSFLPRAAMLAKAVTARRNLREKSPPGRIPGGLR